jgi:hypothetical protein
VAEDILVADAAGGCAMAEPRKLSEHATGRPLKRRTFLSLVGLTTGATLHGGVRSEALYESLPSRTSP